MRVFILGNGPSLNYTPLDLLKGEVCFGVNRINLLYDKTDWRPDCVVRGELVEGNRHREKLVAQDVKQSLEAGAAVYLQQGLAGVVRDHNIKGKIHYFYTCPHDAKRFDDVGVPEEWHLPSICTFATSVHMAMQIAVQYGADELYLVGCDLGYEDGKSNHFDEKYERDLFIRPARYLNGDAMKGYEIAKRSCPVPIYNATVGGSLELFPRVDLEKLLVKGAFDDRRNIGVPVLRMG